MMYAGREHLERGDQTEQQVEEDHRGQQRHGDRPEPVARAGAVHLGRLIQLPRDLLQPGEEDHHRGAELPDREEDHRREHQVGVADPAAQVDPEEAERVVDRAVVGEHRPPHDRHADTDPPISDGA